MNAPATLECDLLVAGSGAGALSTAVTAAAALGLKVVVAEKTAQFGGELLKMRTGIVFTHVPYKGGILAMTDLVGGHVQFTIDGGSHLIAQIDAGRVRMLAVTTPTRLPQYPDTPTLAESGLPGYEASAWQMLMVTGGTPKPVVEKIQAEVSRILNLPDVSGRLQKLGILASGMSTTDTEAFLRAEMTKWADVVRASGAKLD